MFLRRPATPPSFCLISFHYINKFETKMFWETSARWKSEWSSPVRMVVSCLLTNPNPQLTFSCSEKMWNMFKVNNKNSKTKSMKKAWGLQLYWKRDPGTGIFLWILLISKNTFFTEHLWATASDIFLLFLL